MLSPTHLAAVDGATRLDYGTLRARVVARALDLHARGLRCGDRLAILEPNSIAYFEAAFAAAGLGAILVNLNTRLAPAETARILQHCGARMLLAHPDFRATVDSLRSGKGAWSLPLETVLWSDREPPSVSRSDAAAFAPQSRQANDVAHLYYTSGTTGDPKGVMLTHGNVAWHALGTIGEFKLDDRDVWLHAAPMFHLADAWAIFAITWAGGVHVFAPRFEEHTVLDLFERECVTVTNLVPTMLQRLVSHESIARRRFPALRWILSGGAPIAPAVVRRVIDAFGAEYVQTYGMSETSPYLTLSLLKQELRMRSEAEQFRFRAKTGRPFATVELKVVRDDGTPVAADGVEVGEIRARGPSVTPGYWNDAEATARAFVDGWLCTGDLATIDAEGYLDIVDRKKDMIITGGEKVYSTEVEHALHTHPDVLECAVFGLPDAEWGERVEAAVVLRPGGSSDAEALRAHLRGRIAAFKVPRRICFLDELPKTGTGKISKRRLRDPSCGVE